MKNEKKNDTQLSKEYISPNIYENVAIFIPFENLLRFPLMSTSSLKFC